MMKRTRAAKFVRRLVAGMTRKTNEMRTRITIFFLLKNAGFLMDSFSAKIQSLFQCNHPNRLLLHRHRHNPKGNRLENQDDAGNRGGDRDDLTWMVTRCDRIVVECGANVPDLMGTETDLAIQREDALDSVVLSSVPSVDIDEAADVFIVR